MAIPTSLGSSSPCVALFLAALGAAACLDQAGEQPAHVVPSVGGAVRFVAPKLGSAWHVGMFNRLRVEPPCYVVALFSTDGTNQLQETFALAELAKLQAHRRHAEQFPLEEAWPDVAIADSWVETPLDSLQRVNLEQCPAL